MDAFRKGDGPQTPGGRGDDSDLSSVFNYPSLGQLFDAGDARPLEEMRARLTRTAQGLERVVRQGPKDDAERAARAARAVAVTLQFLDDLEKLRREGGQQK
ncbi:MAG TPA: hypothetical protein VM936_13175 [Pyrinomonadaceae bacterium]|nr:hypothetical protein [Pyrinomonadaceae bacterium]